MGAAGLRWDPVEESKLSNHGPSEATSRRQWQVWVDTGGTFTDCVAVDPEGRRHRAKVLSTSALRSRILQVTGARTARLRSSWQLPSGFLVGTSLVLLDDPGRRLTVVASDGAQLTIEVDADLPRDLCAGSRCELRCSVQAPTLAAHLVTRTKLLSPLPPLRMRLATTRATNALLQRRGAPTALFVSRGLGDLLAIGDQQRPDLFALEVRKPAPLYSAVIEVPERLAADGTVLEPLQPETLTEEVDGLLGAGITSAAVALMHSYCNPAHELLLRDFLRGRGFTHVSCSADLAPLIGILSRAQTAVVDAYLARVVGDYLTSVGSGLPPGSLHVMTSAGGLVASTEFRAKDALLSGPAGGVVGASMAGRRCGRQHLITLDMGGTSTDVARWHGDYEYLFEHRVGDARLVAPALAIESVAAGGGSICRCEGRRLRVGPDSAGADPGPASYGGGGPLALTDVNLLLGRIAADHFEIPIDATAAEQALHRTINEADWGADGPPSREAALEGFLQIANERMANAIRRISVRRGYDPREHTLVAFGGAGPQHACAVATLLDMDNILVPADASLLSATGLGSSLVERFAHRQVLQPLEQLAAVLPAHFAELAGQARRGVEAEGIPAGQVVIRRRLLHLRLLGQDAFVEVEWEPGSEPAVVFAERYRELYGYEPPARPIEVESERVVASERPRALAVTGDRPATTTCRLPLYVTSRSHGVPVYERESLEHGATLLGPALILEQHSSTVVGAGWSVHLDSSGALVLSRGAGGTAA